MTAMIIEDELLAQVALTKTLERLYPDIEIEYNASSVAESVEWLSYHKPDVIFMDVELSDGTCFEIFKQVKVDSDVIMTTAYDNYAVKAFEQGSVDYLLKPIEAQALKRAVERVKDRMKRSVPDWAGIASALHQMRTGGIPHKGKERIIVRFNDKILPIRICDIAYWYSEDKNNFMTTKDGRCFVVDASLDEIASDLDSSRFFKVSRNCIIALDAISSITRQTGRRLLINAVPTPPYELTVSRSRCDDFLRWLEK